MPVAHPSTHGSIDADRPYPIFMVLPKILRESINCTTLISDTFLTISFPDLILIDAPPPHALV